MHVVATAGHVDHGKSTLVRALTGMEPDRWSEERRRGMTIDLGFAWTDLPSGATVAFVDVPGHARFVANMLAGVGPVPAVLFVVAADEGWRRQSAEHLAALAALGVQHGLLVVTRSDLADPEPAITQAREQIARTPLGAVEAVAVSGLTGAGLPDLRAALDRLVARLPEPDAAAPVRLWVDRAFTIRGSGTVVTGTLGAGTVAVGDELTVSPGDRRVRVRGLQTLKTTVDAVGPLARVAVNLRGVDVDEVRRGDALTTPGAWRDVQVLDARLPGVDPEALPRELLLHLGSAGVTARVRPLGDDTARLSLTSPLPLRAGDHALLRDPGEQRIAAGVVVLDADPPALTRRGAAAARARDLASLHGQVDAAVELARRQVMRRRDLLALGGDPAGVRSVGDWLVADAAWDRWVATLPELLADHASAHPLDPSLPLEVVRQALDLPDVRLVAALAEAAGGLAVTGGRVQPAGAAPTFATEVEAALDTLTDRLVQDPFAAPEQPDLDALHLTPGVLAAAVRAGRLLKVADGVYLLPGADARAMQRLAALPQPFSASEARQAWGTTRRVAIPLLEHLDRRRWTHRGEDGRRRVVR